jgi:hypothetical protein
VLQPGLAADAVLCPDGSGALAAEAGHLQTEHHAINTSGRQHCWLWPSASEGITTQREYIPRTDSDVNIRIGIPFGATMIRAKI